MLLKEIVDPPEDMAFLHNMCEKALKKGLFFRGELSGAQWKVNSIFYTGSLSGNALLGLQVDADPKRPSTSKSNNTYISAENVHKWTIVKQEDGTFLLRRKT
jgi:hypothetical protein